MKRCAVSRFRRFARAHRATAQPRDRVTIAAQLSSLAAIVLLFILATPAFADCIANGHWTIAASAFPYTEDLASRRDALPIGSGVFVAYRADGAWTKVQSGCVDTNEHNVLAAAPVNVNLHASVHLTSVGTAPEGTRYEVQFRVGKSTDDPNPFIAGTEMRRVGDYPRSDRFGAVVPNLPAGSYVYSMWVRVLDGPESNTIGLNLQWLTAQGVPVFFPATRAELDQAKVGSDWTEIGRPLTITPSRLVDLFLHAAIDGADGIGGRLDTAWTIDRELPSEHGSVALPATGITLFDDKRAVSVGMHALHLWMRAPGGSATLERVRLEAFSMPFVSVWPYVMPAQHAEADDEVVVTQAGDATQPLAMSPICGRWTKLLDFTLPPSDGTFSWTISGFVGIETSGSGVYGQIGIENVRPPDNPWLPPELATDMGMFDFESRPGADGIYFYGDCSKWGNFGEGGRMSLWIRYFNGCGLPQATGTVTVGRRWATIKLLPSATPHL